MGRPLGKHLDNEELNALVPSRSDDGYELHGLSSEVVRQAHLHVGSCMDYSRKFWKYSLLVNRLSIGASEAGPPRCNCPTGVDCYEVVAGLCPELKATELMMHAALCDHCGPLLRAATRMEQDPTPQEEMLLAELKMTPFPSARPVRALGLWQFAKWLFPAAPFVVIVGLLSTRSSLSPGPVSGAEFATFPVSTHRQQLKEVSHSIFARTRSKLSTTGSK